MTSDKIARDTAIALVILSLEKKEPCYLGWIELIIDDDGIHRLAFVIEVFDECIVAQHPWVIAEMSNGPSYFISEKILGHVGVEIGRDRVVG